MRSTANQHMTLVVCLVLVATLVLGTAFFGMFARSAKMSKIESLGVTADAVGDIAQAYAKNYLMTWEFRTNLFVAAAAAGEDVLICAPNGTVLMCSREIQECEHIGKKLSAEALDLIWQSKAVQIHEEAEKIYGVKSLSVAMPIYNDDGTPLCIVVASEETAGYLETIERTLRIFAITAVSVFLIVIIVLPQLTKYETKQLKALASAARQITHGNFNVKVPTGNKTEEMEDLAIAFNNMAQSIAHADTVRQEFVANVSHELKTPMTTISGYMDGMLDGTIPQEQHRQYMELVSSEVKRLSRMVRNMLEISRLQEQGIPEEKLTDFDICESCGLALISFEQRVNAKKLNVEVDMPEVGLSVHAMQDAVAQIIFNLIDNAVKFANENGELSIRVREQDRHAYITIGNTGNTIDPEELPMIFDRFHKTDKSRSMDRDGFGLGLYIVRTLVLAHGEDIFVTSKDGKTEFTFTMPVSL